ncbi:YxeA family protein [Pseudolactococcus hodotermopsidis]|nr:YxeA family protein [Lactococcus hodotermopsidis]
MHQKSYGGETYYVKIVVDGTQSKADSGRVYTNYRYKKCQP